LGQVGAGMKSANLKHIVICCAFGLLAACAHQTPAISRSAQPDKKAAILYGRFSISHDFAFKNQLALWLQNLDTQKPVYVYFEADQPVYAVQIKPGRYQMAGFVGMNRTHQIKGRHAFPTSRFTAPFTASPGSQIYLGDFSGTATFDSIISEWRVKSFTNNFANTTVEFREKYRNLMTVPAVSIFELQTGMP